MAVGDIAILSQEEVRSTRRKISGDRIVPSTRAELFCSGACRRQTRARRGVDRDRPSWPRGDARSLPEKRDRMERESGSAGILRLARGQRRQRLEQNHPDLPHDIPGATKFIGLGEFVAEAFDGDDAGAQRAQLAAQAGGGGIDGAGGAEILFAPNGFF